jgi:uncharacterized protein involved in cysteine biosynthesis
MSLVALALARAVRSLREPGVVWQLLWPSLLSAVVWSVALVVSWDSIVAQVSAVLARYSWTADWLGTDGQPIWLVGLLLKIAALCVAIPLIYVTAAVLLSVWAIPLILERVGRKEYRDVSERKGGTNLGSFVNSVRAGSLFMVLLLCSLPLWLIPGAGLVIGLCLTAWLNQKTFSYDALMLHADGSEMRQLPRKHRPALLGLGGICALLAYVPFVNLLAPAFCGLAFVHFMLEALRRSRVPARSEGFSSMTRTG